MSDIPTSPSLNTQLANALAAVAQAQDHYAHRAQSARIARNEETDALNRVNEAQKHFDRLVAHAKKSAPRESDWRRSEAFKMPEDPTPR